LARTHNISKVRRLIDN